VTVFYYRVILLHNVVLAILIAWAVCHTDV